MENRDSRNRFGGVRRRREEEDEEDLEEEEDDYGVRDMFASSPARAIKKLKRTSRKQAAPLPVAATVGSGVSSCALVALGASNRNDPLTGLPLELAKPVVLLVSEDGGQVVAFDLFSLYQLVLKKGKTFFKTLFNGKFLLQQAEVAVLTKQFVNYYGFG